MILSPSSLVREAVISKLADPSIGINQTYSSLLPDYPGAGEFSIQFTGKTFNFARSRIRIEDVMNAGNYKFPYMTCFTTAGSNRVRQKPSSFDGLVRVGCDVYLSGQNYLQSAYVQNSEVWCDAVEDAFIRVINGLDNQAWGNGVVYNGELGYERSEMVMGAENWLQVISFKMTFECVV